MTSSDKPLIAGELGDTIAQLEAQVVPRRARAGIGANELLRRAIRATPRPREIAALTGIPIRIDAELPSDDLALEMSDGTTRVFHLGPAIEAAQAFDDAVARFALTIELPAPERAQLRREILGMATERRVRTIVPLGDLDGTGRQEYAAVPGPTVALPAGWIWDGDRRARCRSCQAEIRWAANPGTGKRAPYNPDGTSHFASCPQADRWRRPRPTTEERRP